MADDENTESNDGEADGEETVQPDEPCVVRMELVDSLPGGRAVIGVEQDGEFTWLASKEHVSQQAVDVLSTETHTASRISHRPLGG